MKSCSGPRDKSSQLPIEVAGLVRRPALRLRVQGSKFTALDKPVAVKDIPGLQVLLADIFARTGQRCETAVRCPVVLQIK